MASLYQRASAFWMRMSEPLLLNRKGHEVTARALRSARIPMFPEWYIASSYLAGGAVSLVVLAGSAWGLGRLEPYASLPLLRYGVAIAAAALSFLFTRLGFLAYPRMRAAGRARHIDADLPNVITLLYALTRGGMTPVEGFRVVSAERDVYGEAAVEFGVIVRNVEWMGLDLVTAVKEVSTSTPSQTLRAFLDGFITILNSGADPAEYFMRQAQSRLKHDELDLEKDLEQAATLAEIYVSGLLVLPLLLLVVLAGLSPIAPGQVVLMPFVVFAMIPLGTIVYLIMLETLLPPDALTVPVARKPALADFGMDSLPAETPLLPAPWSTPGSGDLQALTPHSESEKRLQRRLWWDSLRARSSASWKRFLHRYVAHPFDALEISGFVGAAVAGAIGYYAWTHGVTGVDFTYALTGILLLGAALAFIPVSIFHEIRVRRAHRVEGSMPDTLSKLAGFNDRGIGLVQSFQILGRTASGPLAKELQAVGNDVSWNGTIAGALRRLRERVSTLAMTKLTILLERASQATGNLREVLDIAAEDATKTQHLRAQKRQSMMSYVVVCYIVFAVFLYVLYVVANLFYGANGLGAAASTAGPALATGMDPHAAKILFAQAAVIQGVGCGLVAGRLGEGQMLSGVKHAIFLGILAFFIFYLGVI